MIRRYCTNHPYRGTPMHHRTLPLLLCFAAAACSSPRFRASKTVDFVLPATGVQSLVCRTHNGGITVTGDVTTTEISLRAEITIRAHSQVEADATLSAMDVVRETVDGQLRVSGKHPEPLNGMVATFSFTLRVPARMAVQLESHNGDLLVRDTDGPLHLETHNGSIEAKGVTDRVAVTTHNGDIVLSLAGADRLDGTVESHNGDISLHLDGAGTMLEASTHNGTIRCNAATADAVHGKDHLRCRIGDGKGALSLSTHNGNVRIH